MNDFWSKRLGTASPAPTRSTQYPSIPVNLGGSPNTPPVGSNPKAPSSLSSRTCPECGSGNYTGAPTDATRMSRCYDCGYNPRFGSQFGSAGMPASQSKAATPARQVSTSNNYQPGTIVGRIGE